MNTESNTEGGQGEKPAEINQNGLVNYQDQGPLDQQVIINVLYVDDEENNLQAFKASFRRYFNIFTATSVDEGKEVLKEQEIQVLITDQRMPGAQGTDLLAQAVIDYPDQIRILLTGYSDMEAIKDAINRGQIYQYIQKPWNDGQLRSIIENAYAIWALKKRQKDLNQQLILTNEQLEFMLRQKLIS
ncbi:MAG TPA: response regulator [Bacteroidia bacterium]|nr:response regulator [Bacteroidia bacterium]